MLCKKCNEQNITTNPIKVSTNCYININFTKKKHNWLDIFLKLFIKLFRAALQTNSRIL